MMCLCFLSIVLMVCISIVRVYVSVYIHTHTHTHLMLCMVIPWKVTFPRTSLFFFFNMLSLKFNQASETTGVLVVRFADICVLAGGGRGRDNRGGAAALAAAGTSDPCLVDHAVQAHCSRTWSVLSTVRLLLEMITFL